MLDPAVQPSEVPRVSLPPTVMEDPLASKFPLAKFMGPDTVMEAVLALKVLELIVKLLMEMLEVRPKKVPLNMVKLETVMVLLEVSTEEVKPPVVEVAMVIVAMLTVVLIVQVPVPPRSKIAWSPVPGTVLPPAPPELVDQLEPVFQFAALLEIQ